MEGAALDIFIILSVVVSIALGYFLKMNIGYFAITFAYLIGAFILKMSPKAIIGLWPVDFFFTLFAITLFYGFALSNGTLDAMARRVVYWSRNISWFIPIALFLSCIFLAGIGPGALLIFVFMPPIIMMVCKQSNVNPLLGAICMWSGGNLGGWFIIGLNGVITKELIAKSSSAYAGAAGDMAMGVFIKMAIVMTITFFIAYFLLKGYKATPSSEGAPTPLTREQIVNMWLIGIILIFTIVPAVLFRIYPDSGFLKFFSASMNLPLLSIIGVVASILLKLANEKEAMKFVPWNLIILLCGVAMLIGVAVKAGTIKALASLVGTTIPAALMPYGVSVISAAMSYCSSTLGVVMPTLYPIIPGIVEATGGAVDAVLLFALVCIASTFAGLSPFSSVGALSLSGVQDEKERNKLFTQLLFIPFIGVAFLLVLIFIGLLNIG